ncbi:MAG: von Willebrand factor type A-like protein [Gammaproteobacteria bacterium]|nr:MAG: von Willebrand factor type A-like protein [Gammaproteobacteria bacterium]TND03469.1 MAG: von Willebrand factor type A-like protein [Gammaproteobacteria bacterium]
MDLRWCSTTLVVVVMLFGTGPLVLASSAFDNSHRIRDVRFLIDGSGSMHANDPDNRRGSALRLISGIMPAGARSGVWMVDDQATNVVPVMEVDSRWRQMIREASEKLVPTGLTANLEDALRTATKDWSAADPRFDRHLVILFDGYIDMSGSAAENEASRQRVLAEILANLSDAKVTVHAIGLSEGVDSQLLRSLSAATNGRFEYVEKAALLERAFSRVMTNIVAPNAIPTENNEIVVDGTVGELTLVAFRKSKADQATIVDSAGESIDFKSPPTNVSWQREAAFELITIKRPKEGVWKLIAGVDPDNLVIADSSLAIDVTGISNNQGAKSEIIVQTRILNSGRLVTDQSFLETVSVTVLHFENDELRQQWTVFDDGKNGDENPGDGIFTLKLDKPLSPGAHHFAIIADAVNFRRAQRRYVSVQTLPVIATLAADRAEIAGTYRVNVIANRGLVSPETMTVTATIASTAGIQKPLQLERVGKVLWQQTLSNMADAERQEIIVTVAGKNARLDELKYELEPLVFEGARLLVSEAFSARQSDDVKPNKAKTPVPVRGDMSEYVEFEDLGWGTVLWQVMLVNFLVAGAAYGGYRFWRDRMRRGDNMSVSRSKSAGKDENPVAEHPQESASIPADEEKRE